jgi:hypothetical protein
METILEESPSLASEVPAMIAKASARARRQVRQALFAYGEEPLIDIEAASYDKDQVLGDWLPGR